MANLFIILQVHGSAINSSLRALIAHRSFMFEATELNFDGKSKENRKFRSMF